MGVVDRRLSAWVDLVADLLTYPSAGFPRAVLERQFFETFDCWVSWNWMDPAGGSGFTFPFPIPGWPTVDASLDMHAAMGQHPLLRWYASSGDLRPMSTGRVPRAMFTPMGQAVTRNHLLPVGIDQQLSIPYRLGPGHFRAFVLGRSGGDFPAEDFETARQLQPLLRLVDHQYSALRGRPSTAPNAVGLTAREIAVVRLLATGVTASSIANRLAISPRTVHRHLETTYRKLGVSDRVRAVLAAEDAGLLTTSHRPDTDSPPPKPSAANTATGTCPKVTISAAWVSFGIGEVPVA